MSYVLLIHMIVAVTLIGAVTHQALGVLAPVQKSPRSFLGRFRAVNGAAYVNAIVVLYLLVMIVGSIVYPNYRIGARLQMEELKLFKQVGTFELKEHLVALGLGLLPVYWWIWQEPNATQYPATRKVLTVYLALTVWYGFLIGLFLNNIRGIG